jgi:hypothetical protein
MQRVLPAVLFVTLLATVGYTQTPQPFPRPGATQAQAPAPPPASPRQTAPVARPQTPTVPSPATGDAPSAATLGVAVYPGAQFLASYDAGRGQRYYLFGTTAAFADVVGYYRTQLDDRGDLVFKEPATHMFDGGSLGRYREETMAFPPSVTVKDWTSGGSPGYPNPRAGAQPSRFATVVMIVPAPPAAPAAR